MRLVLASASPRRAELLGRLNADFDIEVSYVDETSCDEADARRYVTDIACKKAFAVAKRRKADDIIVIGADTIVIAPDGERLGKPADRRDAKRMLGKLSGEWHVVHTGVALVCAGQSRNDTGVETTEVKFRDLDDSMIERYLDTGEYPDKAGAYAVQGYGAVLVEGIRGCYFNVMGFPLAKLADMLGRFGYRFF